MGKNIRNYAAALILFLGTGAVFGQEQKTENLIKNGDFEIGVDPAECRQAAPWEFESEDAPESWEFHSQTGIAALLKGDAASGARFLRVKRADGKVAMIMQKIQAGKPGRIQVTAKVRGKGEIGFYRLTYNKETSKQTGYAVIGSNIKADSSSWTPFEGSFEYDDKTIVYLALLFMTKEGIDVDDVAVKYETPADNK